MTYNDIAYFKLCHHLGLVNTPFLEVGAAKVGGETVPNLCELARGLGIERVTGLDLDPGPGVDFTCDFGTPMEQFRRRWSHGTFATVALFNVLEHTFDPITILRNATHCVRPGGSLLVVTPAVWNLHSYPADYVRLMPGWYEEYARRYQLSLQPDAFCWLSSFGITKVAEVTCEGRCEIPSYLNLGRAQSRMRFWVSRLTHRAFNTYGRNHFFPYAAVGAAFVGAR